VTAIFRHWNDAPEMILNIDFDASAFRDYAPGKLVVFDQQDAAIFVPANGNYDYIAGMVSEDV